ncbi:MAG: nucleotidyl transferase AbiEii/AbiGii toxin family protein [Elusimicrobia bacterium]|nr:nucleotidyl transferase AbiEii/AbiGii toxin family protein [Elusimicrobiota bacterium]
MKMLHQNKAEFLKILERTSAQTGFPLRLLEKDYYLTIILSRINEGLSPELILKGGTCLNKIYYSYYRLSEDLDFSLKLPQDNPSRAMRRKVIAPIKESIKSFANALDMDIENEDQAGHKESTQYIYYLSYSSVVLNSQDSIKLEIGLRFNPILPAEPHEIKHKFLHPFTGKPLFDTSQATCLALKELAAEKMRAAATRIGIAPRDFYDLGYLLKQGFDFRDKGFLSLFQQKLAEDEFPTDLTRYSRNLGRIDAEITAMKSRLKDELFSVLTISERDNFDLDLVLGKINGLFEQTGQFYPSS